MGKRITDVAEISSRLTELKSATESGYYAPVTSIQLIENNKSNDVIVLDLDYPETESGSNEFRISIPKYWDERSTLLQYMEALDLTIDTIDDITDRSIPIKRESGSWEIDEDRLAEGDYLEGHNYLQVEDK